MRLCKTHCAILFMTTFEWLCCKWGNSIHLCHHHKDLHHLLLARYNAYVFDYFWRGKCNLLVLVDKEI